MLNVVADTDWGSKGADRMSDCTDCILDLTDACPKGAGRAIDDEICDSFISRETYEVNKNDSWQLGYKQGIEESKKVGIWTCDDYEMNMYVCSVCQEPFILESGNPTDNNYNYCPNCGARLKW